jgi:GntR family histidine utilization transcriptional repressor
MSLRQNNIFDTKLPIYQNIKEYIGRKIDVGELRAGMKIPSEAQLGALFKTSRMTVNRALRELAAEGRVLRKQGRGSFVAPPKTLSALFEVKSIAEEIKAGGGKYSCHIHLLEEEKASPALAEAMNIQPYEPLFHSVMVHMNGGIPVQLADRFINPAVAPQYLQQDFSRITPNRYLLGIAPPSSVEHTVEALIPEAWIRGLLKINEAEPCLALRRTTWVADITATHSTFYYPGSRYRFSGRFTPGDSGPVQVY